MNNPLDITEYTKAHMVQMIMIVQGQSAVSPTGYRTYLESLNIDQLRTMVSTIEMTQDELSQQPCVRCVQLGWPHVRPPRYVINGEVVCWTHAHIALAQEIAGKPPFKMTNGAVLALIGSILAKMDHLLTTNRRDEIPVTILGDVRSLHSAISRKVQHEGGDAPFCEEKDSPEM